MKFKPLNNHLLITQHQTKQAGPILIPESAKEKPCSGAVVANDSDLPVKVGDTVYYAKYGGSPVDLDGHSYLILKSDDVLGMEAK